MSKRKTICPLMLLLPTFFVKNLLQCRQLSFPNQNFCSPLVVTEYLLTYHYIIQIIITSRYNAILILYMKVQSEFSLSPPFVIGERIVPYKSPRRSIWRHILSPDFIQHKGCPNNEQQNVVFCCGVFGSDRAGL